MLKYFAILATLIATNVATASYTFSVGIPVSNGTTAQVAIYDFNSDSLLDAVTVNGTPVQWGTLTDSTHELVSDVTIEAWTKFMLGLRDGSITVPLVTVSSATLSQRYDDLPIYQDWQTTPKLHRGVYMNPVSYDETSEPYKQADKYLYDTWWNEYAPPQLPYYRSGLWLDQCTLDLIDRLYKYDDGTPLVIDPVPGTNPPKYVVPLEKPIVREDGGVKIKPGKDGVFDFVFEDQCPFHDEDRLQDMWELLKPQAFPLAPGIVPDLLLEPVGPSLTDEELEILEACVPGFEPRPLLPQILDPDEFTVPVDPIQLPFDGPGSPLWNPNWECLEDMFGPFGYRYFKYLM